jgi:hypothetical protein
LSDNKGGSGILDINVLAGRVIIGIATDAPSASDGESSALPSKDNPS